MLMWFWTIFSLGAPEKRQWQINNLISWKFLETFRRALSWWIKTEVLFFICSALNCYSFSHSLLAIHSFLQCVEFKNFCSFAVCSVLLFFHNLCQLNTAWIKFTAFVFRCLFTALYSEMKKWAYLKNKRVLLYSKMDKLVGFSSSSLSF